MENETISPAIKKKSKSKKWFWILGIIVILAFGYIGYDKYSEWRYGQDEIIYQNGAYLGYNQAILQIVKQVNTCQLAPINYVNQNGQNITINILKAECLQSQVVK